MLILFVSIFYICISVTVSEEQPLVNVADYGIHIDNKEGSLDIVRHLNTMRQRYPQFDEPRDTSLGSVGTKPCVEPRVIYDSLGFHDVPNRGRPDTLAQLKPIKTDRNDNRIKPDPQVVPIHPNEQIKVSQTVNIEETSTPGKIPKRIPPSAYLKTAEDYNVPTTITHEENIMTQPIEIVPDYIITHNDVVPSHSEIHQHLHALPHPSHPTSTKKLRDKKNPGNKDNIHLHKNEEEDRHGNLAEQQFYVFETPEHAPAEKNPSEQPKQKPKVKPEPSIAPLNCEINPNTEKKEETESPEDFLPQSRRSLSPGGTKTHTTSGPKTYATSSTHAPTDENTLSQTAPDKDLLPTGKDDDNSRYGYVPSMPLYSPNSNMNYVASSPVAINGPSYPFLDPTKGVGISSLSDPRVVMMETNRVCYACSSLTDPSCWFPQKATTVKYCRPGHNVCVTKTYRSNPMTGIVVIRDCSSSCDMTTSGLNTPFESCSVCKEDLCNYYPVENGAFTNNAINFVYILVLSGLVKFTF